MGKIIFWNVDTQKDFVDKDGKLSIVGADTIRKNLAELTNLAYEYKIRVVNTADYHLPNDKEISDNPDFKTTFPPHCLIMSDGAEFIKETNPKMITNGDIVEPYYTIDWVADFLHPEIKSVRNIIIRKNHFDVFEGNSLTDKVLEILKPDIVVVYGVATNVCVNFAVLGLRKRGYTVLVVTDAIKELPNLDVEKIYDNWKKQNVSFINVEAIKKLLEK